MSPMSSDGDKIHGENDTFNGRASEISMIPESNFRRRTSF
jgi:hypothetical protein